MTVKVQELLQSFEQLGDEDKRELVSELLRRSSVIDSTPLTNEELIGAADELFLQLDRDEAAHA